MHTHIMVSLFICNIICLGRPSENPKKGKGDGEIWEQ